MSEDTIEFLTTKFKEMAVQVGEACYIAKINTLKAEQLMQQMYDLSTKAQGLQANGTAASASSPQAPLEPAATTPT